MKIRYVHIFFAIIIILVGGIWLTSQVGLFATTRSASSTPLQGGGGRQIQPVATESIAEGVSTELFDVANTRGSFTLVEVEQFYKVTPEVIIEAFSLSRDTNPSTFQLRDLKEIYAPVEIDGQMYEVETDTVKVFVSLYSGIPYVSDETFYLPEKAVRLLISENRLTPEEESYWEAHTFNLESLAQDELAIVQESGAVSFTGNTTIAALFSMGLNEETFKEITGFEVPEDTTITIRNFVFTHDLGFDDVSEELEMFFQ